MRRVLRRVAYYLCLLTGCIMILKHGNRYLSEMTSTFQIFLPKYGVRCYTLHLIVSLIVVMWLIP